MADHVHVYDMKGRCIRSTPLRNDAPNDDAASEIGATVALRRTLLDLGFVLREWDRAELGGTAVHAVTPGHLRVSQEDQTADKETFLVRIKSDPMQRDMRRGGVTMHLESVRRNGATVDLLDAWVLEPQAQ